MARKIKTDDELLAMMPKPKSKEAEEELDLEIIGGGIGKPAMAEITDAGRSDAGHVLMDESGTSSAPGVRQALAVAAPNPSEVGRLEVCLREFGFTALTVDEFLQVGIDELNQSLLRSCRAGAAFWAAQEALKNTDSAGRSQTFKEWIAQSGLTEQRVYESISLAKFYARLADDKRGQLLQIGKKPALLLASLPQEVIDQAAESGNDLIGKADLMTVAELKEEIAALKRREKNYEAEIERAQSQVKRLLESKKRTTEFLPRTEEIREECMALQLGAELNLNSLQKLFDEVRAEDPALPEWRLQIEQVWIAAHVVAARALDMVERMKNDVREGDMPERIQGQHILSPAEAERWMLDYPMIENRHAAEKAARQEKRDAAKPKGPGRPKGSTNKATGE